MLSTTTSWNLLDGKYVCGNLQLSALTISSDMYTWRLGLRFICSRNVDGVDKRVLHVFKNAIEGKAHEDMQPNSSCTHEDVEGDVEIKEVR